MDTAQGGDLVIQLDPTEVLPSFVLNILPVSSHMVIPSIPTMFSHRIVLIRPSVPFHPITQTVPHVLSTVSTHGRPERSSDYNHNLEVELIDPNHLYPNKFNIIRLIAEPESTWEEKNPKMAADSPLWTFWCAPRVSKAVLTFLLQCLTFWWTSHSDISLRKESQVIWRRISRQYTFWSRGSSGGSRGTSGGCVDRPACVLILTTMYQHDQNEPGQ